jgi:hypothetical protein
LPKATRTLIKEERVLVTLLGEKRGAALVVEGEELKL